MDALSAGIRLPCQSHRAIILTLICICVVEIKEMFVKLLWLFASKHLNKTFNMIINCFNNNTVYVLIKFEICLELMFSKCIHLTNNNVDHIILMSPHG